MVANSGGHIISGNHWFQGDRSGDGVRFAGLVLAQPNIQTTINGNHIDNASIEWTNEHSAEPDFTGKEFSFGGLTITGNTCLCFNTAAWFTWLTVKPHGSGHFIHGLTVTSNVFRALYGNVDRIERVDTSIADLDYNNMRKLQFERNVFDGIESYVSNPLMLQHDQLSAAAAWSLPVLDGLLFKGWATSVQSVVAESALTNANGTRTDATPWVQTEVGTTKRQIRLNWPLAVKDRVCVYARMDRPK